MLKEENLRKIILFGDSQEGYYCKTTASEEDIRIAVKISSHICDKEELKNFYLKDDVKNSRK